MAPPTVSLATAFIDWNSQIHAAKPQRGDPQFTATKTLEYVTRTVGKALSRADRTKRFDVSLRVYHGWRRGFQASENFTALLRTCQFFDFSTCSENPNIVIRADVRFGDFLNSALAGRVHQKIGCHLPNTLRSHKFLDGEIEEKMVDTALASDVVSLAYEEKDRWLVVVGEDDDIVPPVFVAEAARGPSEGRVLLVRKRSQGPFLKLEGIHCQP